MRKQPGYTIFTTAIFGALALMSGSVAMAAPLTVPNTFLSGQPATAASVNTNFGAVKSAVDDNDARVTTNAGGVATNAGNISSNTTAISGNTTSIGTNTTNIGANTTNIGTNTTDIGTNTTNIGNNFSSITGNTTDIGTNTAAIAGHGTRITALETGGGGGGAGVAIPVTIDCATAGVGAIQAAIDAAAPVGRMTITINGTCSENVVVNRDNVTLLGGAPGVIQGNTTSPTVSVEGRRGLIIKDISILGGLLAVILDGSEAKIESSTIGSNTTVSAGLGALNSEIEFIGGTLGNTINGGITPGESEGLFLAANSVAQFSSGDNTVQAGPGGSPAIIVEIGSKLISGDLATGPTTLSVTGNVEVLENSTVVLNQASITGDVTVGQNSTLTLEADTGNTVSISGTLFVSNNSSALLESFGTLNVQNLDIRAIGSVNVAGNARINGNVTMASFASLFFNVSTTGADIPGTFTCFDFNSRVGTNSGVLANNYSDGGGAVIGPAILCGYSIP